MSYVQYDFVQNGYDNRILLNLNQIQDVAHKILFECQKDVKTIL